MIDVVNAILKHAKGEINAEAKRRAAICAGCELKKKAFYADFLNSTIVEINGYVCSLCDCPLATKILAEQKENICNKWK